MKQSRIGLGVVTMLSIFVVVCMCVLVLFSSNKVYQIHEQTNRSYAFKKAYYEAEIKAHKLIDENQTDFLVHVKGDTYLKVKVKDDKIVIFKTIVKGVNKMEVVEILKKAIDQNASDIFFVAGSPCMFKVGQQLVKVTQEKMMPNDTKDIVQQLYGFAPYCSYENFVANGEDDFSFSLSQVGRFRVNVYRQRNSEAAVLRVVNFDLPNPEDLNIPESVLNLSDRRKGIILVSGPAGSGKSTTLACLIDRMNETRSCHIITIEDPIEFLHSHKKSIVSQREVYHDTASYLNALKSALREAPEVILLGEMRDEETVSTALSAAETGHLILSTLHTVGAVNTIDRIIDMFQGHQDQVRSQLSMILEAIISEQLIPGKDGELIPVFEIMLVNPAIRSQIRENKIHQIENTMISNRQNGMVMMDDAIYDLYQQGKITKDIAIQYSLHPDRMKTRVQ